MSGYLSHFLGYVLQIFKKENSRKINSSSIGSIARKCNSVIKDQELKKQIEKIAADSETSKCNLKRVNSCPQLEDENIVHTKDGPRCRTCADKLIILASTEDSASPATKQDSQQNKSEEISTTDSWNSVGFVGQVKIFNSNSLLRRFRSLDLQSLDEDHFYQNEKSDSRNIYHSAMGAGDGKYNESKNFENFKLNRTQKVKDQSGAESTRIEHTFVNNIVLESSLTKDPPKMESETSDEKMLNNEALQESCYFDVATVFKQEAKKAEFVSHIDEVKAQLEYRNELIPEFLNVKHLTSLENTNLESFQPQFYDDIEENEVYATPFQDRRLSCKSKIPVHQRVRRLNEGDKFMNFTQSGWRRSSRTNLCNWPGKNRTYRVRVKRCHTRRPTSSITTAYRHQLNSKLDFLFREFSNKIYRGNIMDYNSHSRWMKLAGIVEDEDASSFKSYAKSKVVLTLSEYKEALLKMCEDHHLDYWDVLKKMTDVQRGNTFSCNEKDEKSVEEIEERLTLNHTIFDEN